MAPVTAPVEPEASTDAGSAMHALVAELFPIHRSVTGPGVRATLARLAEEIPLEVREVPSGTEVLDWTVPPEWSVRDAYVADPDGRRVIDLADSTLHVVGHSAPFRARMPWRELRERVHTLPERPDWIPYRIDWGRETWGFCMAHAAYQRLDADPDRQYEVVIDAELDEGGSLAWGEAVLPGESDREALVWTHVCHPSLANDGLSGLAVSVWLAKRLADRRRRLTWRFVFAPATIGAIAWLAENRDRVDRIDHGLVLACLGDPGSFTWKRSRRGDAVVDRAVARVLEDAGLDHELRDFEPVGYDERQFGSPGFDLPVGRLTRTPNGEYPEYHTSADDLDLVRPDALAGSLAVLEAVADVLETNRAWINTRPMGEPRLGRHGLHAAYGSGPDREEIQRAVLWTLNLSDGTHDLLAVAERSGLPFAVVRRAAEALAEVGLLKPPDPDVPDSGTPEREDSR